MYFYSKINNKKKEKNKYQIDILLHSHETDMRETYIYCSYIYT